MHRTHPRRPYASVRNSALLSLVCRARRRTSAHRRLPRGRPHRLRRVARRCHRPAARGERLSGALVCARPRFWARATLEAAEARRRTLCAATKLLVAPSSVLAACACDSPRRRSSVRAVSKELYIRRYARRSALRKVGMRLASRQSLAMYQPSVSMSYARARVAANARARVSAGGRQRRTPATRAPASRATCHARP